MDPLLLRKVVPDLQLALRLRNYAQTQFSEFFPSNKSIKKAIEEGRFLVNDKIATTATLVKAGDVITVKEAPYREGFILEFPLEVLFEDEYCAIISKPSGISIHNHYKRNIVNALAFNLSKSKETDALSRPMPVHRLDSLTSGLLIVAKTHTFQVKMGTLIEKRKVRKTYTAILVGESPEEGHFNRPVGDKKAFTEFVKTGQSIHPSLGTISLVKLWPHTGRTHQLRIHAAAYGNPILGERNYAQHIPNLKGKGLFLCATKLEFDHPITDEAIFIEMNPPKKFSKYFNFQK